MKRNAMADVQIVRPPCRSRRWKPAPAIAWAVALLFMSAGLSGCVGRRYVEERLYGPARAPSVHSDAVAAPTVRQETFDAVALSVAPAPVQAAFRNDHPSAAVTAVQASPVEGGAAVYRVTYLEDGAPGVDMFRPDGRPLRDQEYVWVAPHSSDPGYWRTAKPIPSPATQPLQ